MIASASASASAVISSSGRPATISSRFCASAASPAGFVDDDLRNRALKFVTPICPPFLCGLLMPRDYHVTTGTSDQVADKRCFQVHRFHASPQSDQRKLRLCSKSCVLFIYPFIWESPGKRKGMEMERGRSGFSGKVGEGNGKGTFWFFRKSRMSPFQPSHCPIYVASSPLPEMVNSFTTREASTSAFPLTVTTL